MSNNYAYSQLYYDNAEFAVTPGASNYDVFANQSALTTNFGIDSNGNNLPGGAFATKAVIRTDGTITVKFNSTSADAITVTSADSPFTMDKLVINKIYISSTTGANVKILLKEE